MERFDRRLHVRVGETDVERAHALSEALNITTSALVRLLLQLPAEDVAARRHLVIDLACANRLYRELNQWGYQQNQAAHALNRIAYYLRREAMDASDVQEELASVGHQLERLRERTDEFAAPVREVAESRLLFLQVATMPLLKPISGHTSCKGVYRHLTKDGRALAADYLKLDVPDREDASFDWAAAMDGTRTRWRNDTPWGDRPCRTYKHYVLSPGPKDHVELDALRELTVVWAREHFGDHEVAIVYHDDNAGHIPHVHIVVNNTNIATSRRLQDPDPKELKHSLQRMSKERGLSDFDSVEENRPCASACGAAHCRQSTCAAQSARLQRRAATPGWRTSAPASALHAPSRGARTSSGDSSRAWTWRSRTTP